MPVSLSHGPEEHPLSDVVPVEVRVDGGWWPGWVDSKDWRQVDGRWRVLVRWRTGPAENRLGWFDQDNVRQA